MHLELLKGAVLLGLKSFCYQEIEPSDVGTGLKLPVPPLPIQFADPLPQLCKLNLGKNKYRPLNFSDCRHCLITTGAHALMLVTALAVAGGSEAAYGYCGGGGEGSEVAG